MLQRRNKSVIATEVLKDMHRSNSPPQPEPSHRKRRAASGWLVPISALTSLLRKARAAQSSRKLEAKTNSNMSSWRSSFKIKKKKKTKPEEEEEEDEDYNNEEDEEEEEGSGFGDGGIWQRAILMGDKCHPLEFSGAIFYDEKGNKVEEMTKRVPRSPLSGPYSNKGEDEEGEFGDGGVWQRAILMGGKCQPLEFSGVICYDEKGKKLDGVPPPRTPHRSPLPSFMSGAFFK